MNAQQIRAALARQSTANLFALRQKHMGVNANVPATKAQLIDVLGDLFAQVGAPAELQQAPAAAPVATDPRVDTVAREMHTLRTRIDQIAGFAQQTEDSRKIMNGDLSRIGQSVYDIQQEQVRAAKLAHDTVAAISALSAKVSASQQAISPDAVAGAIAEAVRKGFDGFAAKAKAEGTVDAIVAQANQPQCINNRTALELFGVDACDTHGNPLTFDVWDDPTAPAVDPDFLWTESILIALAGALRGDFNIWLGGDKGVGKSETARQFAARTGRAFTRINFQKYTEAADFIGGTGLVNGATEFVPGDFLLAYTRPGCVMLLDEISNCQPGALAVINGLLEPRAHQNIGGKFWSKASGVLIMGADNTMGTGDESGQFSGTNAMNSATLDRFAVVYHMQWLPTDVEAKAIVNRTGCAHELALQVVGCLSAARAKVQTGEIVSAPSIRAAISLCTLLPIMGLDAAWDAAIANRQPSESAAALASIRAACLNESTVMQYV